MTPKLLFVVGPTACGKSEIAVEIAERVSARVVDIINSDSVQFFEGVNIGAAKPGPELLARATHHLVGHMPVGSTYTAGHFREDALKILATGLREGIVVGGSGFYVQALEKGMFDVPEIPPGTREKLETEASEPGGWQTLYRELQARDPQAAEKIQPADRYRVLRALEILRTHSGTLTAAREKFAQKAAAVTQPFSARKLGVFRSRDALRERITERTRLMLTGGLIEEVQALRAELRRLAPDGALDSWAPLRSVGYSEVGAFLDGKLSREELAPLIITSTMQLAKRQMTWFKRDSSTVWFDLEHGSTSAIEAALALFEA